MICWGVKLGKALMPWGIHGTRGDVIRWLEWNYKEPWKELRRKGWRVVKVEVRELAPADGAKEASDG